MNDDIILEVKNLSTHFNTQDGVVKAVNDISFSLKKGEILGIVGESGCGKSVSVMSLLQLIPTPPGKIVSGSVMFQGNDLLQMSERALQKIRGNNISVIFQDPMTSLNPYMKISKQIMEPLIIHKKLQRGEALRRTIQLLEMVGISDVAQRVHYYPHEFSGGMRQRVMIAMALACEPDILIADEPTTALDVSVQIQVLEIIKDLSKKLGTAVIFITHDLGVVAHMCDRVNVMYAGRIVEEAAVDELFHNGKHPYTEGLIESVAQLYEKTSGTLSIIEGQPPMLINMPDACLFYPRCKYAHDACLKKLPPPIKISEHHSVKCFLHEKKEPQKEVEIKTEHEREKQRSV